MRNAIKSRTSLRKFFLMFFSFTLLYSCGGSKDIWNKLISSTTAKEITSFSIISPASIGFIDESSKTINATLPNGTSRSSLIAQFSNTGIKVSVGGIEQISGQTANDFSNTLRYTVTAADGSSADYNVTIKNAASNEKDITSFSINSKNGTISNSTISLVLPFGTDLTALKPLITHTGASITPLSGVAQNFTNPVLYTVTAADSSNKVYTVSVTTALSDSKDISKFTILGNDGIISGTDITLTVPYNTDVTALQPTIVYSGASISPASGAAQNFTNPVTYTVTAKDGSTKQYKATVVTALSSSKDIISFTILGITGSIIGTDISLTVPYGTDLTTLTPSITYSGSSINPSSGTSIDFTNPIIYIVTAADSSTKQYTITVKASLNSAKDITAFEINGTAGVISGTNISITLPYGTSITSFAPIITYTGTNILPSSGAYADFTNPVIYTVTAADGSTKTYTATVTLASNSGKDITVFSINGINGIITGTDISVTLLYGTDASSLTAVCTYTGVSINPSPVIPQNYTTALQYIVTAADSSTKSYTVTVTIAPKVAVTGVAISPSTPIVSVNSSTQLTSAITPSNASIKTVTWTSSEPSIASVSSTGLVTGKKSGLGSISITCTSTDNLSAADVKTITINPAPECITSTSGSGIGSSVKYSLTSGAYAVFIQTTVDSISSSTPIVHPITLTDVGTSNAFKSLMLADAETTYELWLTVYTWALSNGYTFENAGQKGSGGNGNTEQPITNISWRDAIVWCNAFTEYYNIKNGVYPDLNCAYYNDSTYTTPLRSTSDSAIDAPYVYNSTNGNTDNSICTATGFRLPGTYEWEYAARYLGTAVPTAGNLASEYIKQSYNGGSSILTPGYYWTPGDYASGATADYTNTTAIDLVAWYSGNSSSTTYKVRGKLPNALGLYDMSGNVREWCYEIAYSTYRADRGGSYYNDSSYLQIGKSDTGNAPNFKSNIYGFRIAKNK